MVQNSLPYLLSTVQSLNQNGWKVELSVLCTTIKFLITEKTCIILAVYYALNFSVSFTPIFAYFAIVLHMLALLAVLIFTAIVNHLITVFSEKNTLHAFVCVSVITRGGRHFQR